MNIGAEDGAVDVKTLLIDYKLFLVIARVKADGDPKNGAATVEDKLNADSG
jgi:hypothetical protein